MKVRLYWSRMRVPVTFHLQRDWRFTWRRIYGIAIGTWFLGAFRAEADSLQSSVEGQTHPGAR